MTQRIVICGHGRTGAHVASILAAAHDVTAIDRAPERLPEEAHGLEAVEGDATDPAVLIAAGAREAGALIAVTGDDAANALIAMLAKRRLGVRRVVALVNDADHAWLFGSDAGVDVVASIADLVARLVQEEVTAGDLVTLLTLRGAGVAVTETTLPPGASAAGLRAAELTLPAGVALTAVIREGEVILPERADRLIAGDVVVALCEPGREPLLHRMLVGDAGL
jgi:trk system potassium uptake protein TrkA